MSSSAVVIIAKSAGYDSLFIDLEHTTLGIKDVLIPCQSAFGIGITPFVRVPWQCGNGFVQRVLDSGVMGVIFPHVYTVGKAKHQSNRCLTLPSTRTDWFGFISDEARAAIHICKYAPHGCRCLTAGLPQFCFQNLSPSITAPEANKSSSVVFIMIETKAALDSVEEIAVLPALGVLLVGAND